MLMLENEQPPQLVFLTPTSSPNSDSTSSSADTSAESIPTLSPSCQWEVHAYNASDPEDLNQVFINGTTIIQLPNENGIMQDTDWIDITSSLSPHTENVVRFLAYNHNGNATWGFSLRRDSDIVVDKRNGNTTTISSGLIAYGESYAIKGCEFHRLEPTGEQWIIQVPTMNGNSNLYIDEQLAKAWHRGDSGGIIDISEWILNKQTHILSIECYPSRIRGDLDQSVIYEVVKNGQIIFSRKFGSASPEKLYIFPDGRIDYEISDS